MLEIVMKALLAAGLEHIKYAQHGDTYQFWLYTHCFDHQRLVACSLAILGRSFCGYRLHRTNDSDVIILSIFTAS